MNTAKPSGGMSWAQKAAGPGDENTAPRLTNIKKDL